MTKAMNARPSEAQLRMHREGVDKMSALKMDEEFEKTHDHFPNVRSASPSPICDRLHAEGVAKMRSSRNQEDERKQRVPPSPQLRRNVTSSPVCDRLYQEGLSQVARNTSRSRNKSVTKSPETDTQTEHCPAQEEYWRNLHRPYSYWNTIHIEMNNGTMSLGCPIRFHLSSKLLSCLQNRSVVTTI